MKINRLNIGTHLLEYQLSLIEKTMGDALKDDMWFFNWTLTEEQHIQFKKYAISLIKKVFKCNKTRAEQTFSWFNLEFGLRIKNS
jgi:hypothetical protein